ncbi:MAG: hypothetical protein R3F59_19620 [Myxococcota bacterium]
MAVTAASFLAFALWTGCTSAPVFNQITDVTVQTQGPGGIARQALEGEKLERATRCLYRTEEIRNEESKKDPLQEILLIQVKDRYADRVFEFYTDENMKGNKGKYYRNGCIFQIIKGP